MYRQTHWRTFALPGVAWLCLFVVVPAYAVLAMAMGKVNLLLQPVPEWNPATWNPGFLSKAFSGALPGGEFWPSVRNTIVYVGASLALCFAIGYPVAYYVALPAARIDQALRRRNSGRWDRRGGQRRRVLLAAGAVRLR